MNKVNIRNTSVNTDDSTNCKYRVQSTNNVPVSFSLQASCHSALDALITKGVIGKFNTVAIRGAHVINNGHVNVFIGKVIDLDMDIDIYIEMETDMDMVTKIDMEKCMLWSRCQFPELYHGQQPSHCSRISNMHCTIYYSQLQALYHYQLLSL